jgi:endoglucanase
MRRRVRSLAAAVATALLASALIVGGGSATASAATPAAPIPTVVGNKLVDSRTGAIWTAHAVNWPSFEYACQQGWAYAQDGRTDAAAKAMVSWGINAVRLPLNEDCWLGTDGSPRYGNPAGYQRAIRQWVDILNANGIVVILDLHWSGGTGLDSSGQRPFLDDQSPLFWRQVSSAYSTVPSVMFDAFNEPYSTGSYKLSWSCWANGGCAMPTVLDGQAPGPATYTTTGMKDIVAAIRAAGAAQPVLLGGLDYSNDLGGWLANRPNDSQLVASWHNYPGQRCQTVACWNSDIAPVAAQVPVIATELGETDGGTSFLTTFMDWADAKGVGYAPWAWWWTDASDGAEANAYALIQNGGFQPRAPQGTTYHDHLARLSGTPAPPAPPSPPPVQPPPWPWDGSGRLTWVAADALTKALYQDVLHRAPDPSGMAYWPGALMYQGLPVSFAVDGVLSSAEYDGARIDAAYQSALGRLPEPEGRAYWLSQIMSGALPVDQVQMTLTKSDEFYAIRSGGDPRRFVDYLYSTLLGRAATADDEAAWSGYMARSGRAAAVDAIYTSVESGNRRVNALYQAYFARDADPSGLAYWTPVVIAQGDQTLRGLLVNSPEYVIRAVARYPNG